MDQQKRQFKWPPQPLHEYQPPQRQKRFFRRLYRPGLRRQRIRLGCCLALLLFALSLGITGGILFGGKLHSTFTSHFGKGTTVSSLTPSAKPTQPPGRFPATDITVDFAQRQNHAHSIAADLLGLNGFTKISNSGQILSDLSSAHIHLVRVSVDMVDTFPTAASISAQQQNWTRFDQVMTIILAQGIQPILLISYSPSWLQPPARLCGSGDASHVMPTYMVNGQNLGPQKWGALAAQVVAHMDHRFPGVHPAYELWNEPDGTTFMCVAATDPNPDLTRLNNYRAIYATAAQQMKQQAQQDGTTIRVGGPALAYPQGHASTWIPALLNDPAIAPYVDFISYHQYLIAARGSRDTWGGIVAAMQNYAQLQGSSTGFAAEFEYISSLVRAGKQHDPASTPIYIDEYNIDSAGSDCCRNSRTYGSLWHALLIADLLNTVNNARFSFGPAQNPVAGLAYFSALQPPPSGQFCLFGTWDTAMDCATDGVIAPYPPYYAFELLGDPRFLDITDNGFLAGAPVVKPAGLVVTGFFTNTKDNVLIVNPNATGYTQLAIGVQNPGLAQVTPSLYVLNQADQQIALQPIALTTATNGFIATISVPAYSIVALSLTVAHGTASSIAAPSHQQSRADALAGSALPSRYAVYFGVAKFATQKDWRAANAAALQFPACRRRKRFQAYDLRTKTVM